MLRGSNGRHYIGSTINLEERLVQHRRGHTYTTRRLGTVIELLASRCFETIEEARKVERQLKAKKNPGLALFQLLQP